MKKLIMTAVAAAISFGAFAANTESVATGTFSVVANDQITLTPSGNFGVVATNTFSTPAEFAASQAVGTWNFNVTATRSFHVNLTATDFNRTSASGNAAISNVVPVGNILAFSQTGDLGTQAGSVSANHSLGSLASGTLGSNFGVAFTVTPGLSNQMSGTYNCDLAVIASLD